MFPAASLTHSAPEEQHVAPQAWAAGQQASETQESLDPQQVPPQTWPAGQQEPPTHESPLAQQMPPQTVFAQPPPLLPPAPDEELEPLLELFPLLDPELEPPPGLPPELVTLPPQPAVQATAATRATTSAPADFVFMLSLRSSPVLSSRYNLSVHPRDF
jgi:hypothetical protein